jgi:Helix-turn-helix domain
VEHRKADTRQVAGFGVSADDTARFLLELRQLRDGAGLGQAELAARAHFPYDSIRAAEVGPALPDLPVLSAYVRGCGGTTEEWEERWRSLTRSPSLPVPAARNAGRSDAATAGARIGSVSQVGDSPDPSIIIAALNRVAEEMASPATDEVPPPADIQLMGDFPADSDGFPAASDGFPAASGSEAFPPEPEPMSDDKPAGWDPIRVSTAWPVIRDTPTAPGRLARSARSQRSAGLAGGTPLPGGTPPASGTQPAGGTGIGTPWGAAPWAGEPLDRASSADRSTARAGGTRSGTARSPIGGAVPAAGGGSGHSAPWTRIAVIAAILICVIAVLLAVFA